MQIRSAWYARALCAVLVAAISVPVFAARASRDANPSAMRRATLAVQTLQSWYNPHTGLYRTTGWWNSANAITVLADYERVSGSKKYNGIFKNTFKAAQKTSPGFINHYYDDEGWWALAWIDAYDVTHRAQYLDMSESIFANMAGGWSNTCGGGIWWSKDRTYKNAIANELFLSVAAHLARRATDAKSRADYQTWAEREWAWFEHSGMINSSHLINDGLNAHCENNHKTTWTYNQGVILGGLAELYRTTHNATLLVEARNIALATLASPVLVDKFGILHEPCEPNCGGDGTQFKGIFMRNLSELNDVAPQPQYERFIRVNARSIWAGAHAPGYQLGLIWAAPYGVVNASTQSSAADALVAAARLAKQRTH